MLQGYSHRIVTGLLVLLLIFLLVLTACGDKDLNQSNPTEVVAAATPVVTTLATTPPLVVTSNTATNQPLPTVTATSPIISYYTEDPTGKTSFGKTFEEHIADLKSTDPNTRRNAVVGLGGLKDKRAVEPLIQALKDPNWEVRVNAAYSLGEINDLRAVQPLIVALKDSASIVRTDAAESLGKLKDKQAFEPLIEAFKVTADNDNYSCITALALLAIDAGRAIPPFITALRDKDIPIAKCAAFALGESKERQVIEPLKKAFDENYTLNISIISALQKFDGAGIDFLADTITNGNESPGKQESAAEILFWFRYSTTSAIDKYPNLNKALTEASKSNNNKVQDAIVRASNSQNFDYVAKALSHPDKKVREWAATTISGFMVHANKIINVQTKDHFDSSLPALESLEPLLNALKIEKDSDVRYAIIWALATIQDLKPVPALEEVVKNDKGQTSRGKLLKEAATEAIQYINDAQPSLIGWNRFSLGK